MLVVLLRDVLLVLGYKVFVPRGYPFEVSFLGRVATWVLYAALCLVIVTDEGTEWPIALFWIGVALAVVAAAAYGLRVRRELARGR
jgi:hypothetical protein